VSPLNKTSNVLMGSKSSSTDPTRFLVASPNGNTGAVVYFVPVSNNGTSEGNSTVTSNTTTGLGATLVNSTLQSVSGDNNQTGVQGELSISEDFDFGVTISKVLLNLCAS
jgi:Na+-translocating ferredoxin:NAD+ oxidoreductase RnfG subunit